MMGKIAASIIIFLSLAIVAMAWDDWESYLATGKDNNKNNEEERKKSE